MGWLLEERLGDIETKEDENYEEGVAPSLKKVGIGLGIYWVTCAGIVYLRDHTEIFQYIASYFK